MGKGMDGSFVTHKGMKVLQVTRIENGRLWSAYKTLRSGMQHTFTKIRAFEGDLKEIAEDACNVIKNGQLPWQQSAKVKKFMQSLNLRASKNEVLLFHGLKGAGALDNQGKVMYTTDANSPLQAVKREGLDDRCGTISGMYGSGIYFADMASKADCYAGQYKGTEKGTVGEEAHLFLCRVTLGVPYKTDQSLENLRRPPCFCGHFDMSLAWSHVKLGKQWAEKGLPLMTCQHERFNSVIQDYVVEKQRKLYREYIVYGKQSYPEYCVRYLRTDGTHDSRTHDRRTS